MYFKFFLDVVSWRLSFQISDIMPSDAKKKRDQKKKEAAKKYDMKKPAVKDGDDAMKTNGEVVSASNGDCELIENGNGINGTPSLARIFYHCL